MKRFRLDRRTLLKGVGAGVALPALECMLNVNGTAYAQGQPLPRRFATWFFGNGVIRSKFTPGTTGAAWALTPELAPLANVKPYVNVVTGYMIKTPNLRGHHNGVAGVFSGYPFIVLPGAGQTQMAQDRPDDGGLTISDDLSSDDGSLIDTESAGTEQAVVVVLQPSNDTGEAEVQA